MQQTNEYLFIILNSDFGSVSPYLTKMRNYGKIIKLGSVLVATESHDENTERAANITANRLAMYNEVNHVMLCDYALTVFGHFFPQTQRFTCLITGKQNTMINSDPTLS